MSPPGAPNTKIFKGWACLLRVICFSPLWKKTRFSLHPEVLKPSVGRLPRPPGRVNYPSDAHSTQHWPQRVVRVCLRPRLSHRPSKCQVLHYLSLKPPLLPHPYHVFLRFQASFCPCDSTDSAPPGTHPPSTLLAKPTSQLLPSSFPPTP